MGRNYEHLTFRYGVMNSKKTTDLITDAHHNESLHKQILVVKPSVDLKGGTEIVSKLGVTREADILAAPDMNLRERILDIHQNEHRVDMVYIDEAQFLAPEQVDQIHQLAILDHITQYAYGLKTDFQRNFFPGSARLFERATKLTEHEINCRCDSHNKATQNTRKVNGEFVFEGEQVAIDGQKLGTDVITYQSLCDVCYFEELELYEARIAA